MNKFLLATEQIIAERGVKKTTIAVVAARADRDKLLVYKYFGSLNGMLEAYVQKLFNQLDFHLSELVANQSEPTTLLQLVQPYLLTYTRLFQTNQAWKNIYCWQMTNPKPEVSLRIREILNTSLEKYSWQIPPSKKIMIPMLRLLVGGVSELILLSEQEEPHLVVEQLLANLAAEEMLWNLELQSSRV